MILLNKIYSIILPNHIDYRFEDYIDRSEIYIQGEKEVDIEDSDVVLDLDGDGKKIVEYNFWNDIKNTYRAKIEVHFEDDKNLEIPSVILFEAMPDWELIRAMAILDHLEPEVEYEYFKVGEKYGYSEKTKTRAENKFIKSFLVKDATDKKCSPIDLVYSFLDDKTEDEVNDIVKDYLEYLLELKEEEYFEGLEFEEEKSSGYHSNAHYNDNLDLDQQNPEFWDSL
ncbi:hypothetical protein [Christiangramia echinicola]|uniref:hypothetical protein n=1 Tax=Christiangramia echinicola TaxID=279359 RepID=UPI0004163E40|nr:hypothetical protein [Christiangramia echinicola]